MAFMLNDDEKELVRETLETAGWRILVCKVIAEEARKRVVQVLSYTKTGASMHDAGVKTGEINGLTAFVSEAYKHSDTERPEYLRALKELAL